MRGLSRSAAGAAAVMLAGCGGEPAQTHNVRIDVGGSVVYALDADEALPGVTVTLVDVEGAARTTTTNSSGLWTIENVLPGVYTESYELAGYDPMYGTFAIPAGGENNVKNVFVTRPAVTLSEVPLVATVFGTQLTPGDPLYDGIGGASMVYSSAGNADIVVSFNRRVVNATVRIVDGETGQQIFATPDAARTAWTFTEAQLGTINGGGPAGGITFDQDPYTWSQLRVQNATSYTPIHGDLIAMPIADAYFNVTP